MSRSGRSRRAVGGCTSTASAPSRGLDAPCSAPRGSPGRDQPCLAKPPRRQSQGVGPAQNSASIPAPWRARSQRGADPGLCAPRRRLLRLAAEPSIEHTALVRTHRSSLVHRRVRGPPESIHCEDKRTRAPMGPQPSNGRPPANCDHHQGSLTCPSGFPAPVIERVFQPAYSLP